MDMKNRVFGRGARRMIPVVIGVLGVGFIANRGHAEAVTGYHVEHAVVRYGDLNLDSRAGVDLLYDRIASAARSVCGVGQIGSLSARVEARRCEAEALAHAVAAVDNPALARRYQDQIDRHGSKPAGAAPY